MITRKTRNVAILAIVVLLAMSLWFSASAVVPQLTLEWGLSPTMQAWMTMSVQIGFVAGALLSAVLNIADRIASHRLVAVSALLGAIANAMIPVLSAGPVSALILRFVTGACMAGIYPPGMKIMASWCREERGFCIGILVGALTIGSGLPHLLNTLQAGGSGIPPWRHVMAGTSILSLVSAGLAWFLLEAGPYLGRALKFDWRKAAEGLTDRPTRLANFGYFGHMWELYAMWAWVPVMLAAAYQNSGYSVRAASLASFSIFALGGVACVLAGRWADRWGRRRITIWAMVLSGLCSLIAGLFFDSPVLLTIVCLVWGFAVIADSAQFSAIVSELADSRYVGTALQVQTSIGFLVTMLSLWLVPLLIESVGYRFGLVVLAIGPALGTVSMLKLKADYSSE